MIELNNPLLPHQEEAVEKLIKLKVGALFMEQGTGKTITALEIVRRRFVAEKIDAVIYLCPCSAKGNIKREIMKQCPKEMYGLFVICGIETLSTSIRAISFLCDYAESHNCMLIADESLMIKNPRAFRTKHITIISKKCSYKLILNGTPISRNEADLFSQFYILDWRILGYKSFWGFEANHIEYDDSGKIQRILNTEALVRKISPYTYQVKKSDCISLPHKGYETCYFQLTPQQLEEYDLAANILLMQLDELKPESIYRLFSGLQAIISGKHLVFSDYNRKFQAEEFFSDPMQNPRMQLLLDIIPKNEKAIIFCRYESEVSQICDVLKSSVRFDGSVSIKAREKALSEFAEDKQYLVANRKCAGYSLNLQFCHNIINYSNDWDLGSRLQSEDRVHRIGQKNNVNIVSLCAEGTLDEQILSCLDKKENILDSIKQGIKNSASLKNDIKKYIYGNRHQQELLDCSDL